MINIFVLVTILGHLPVILSAKRKGSDNMKQILIVEDDNLLNKTLTYNLELDGYTITSVLNARTAAESLKTNIFDLVLLDINLPDGNGYDLCRLIKPEHIFDVCTRVWGIGIPIKRLTRRYAIAIKWRYGNTWVDLAFICIPLYNETLRGCFTVGEKKKYQKK